MDVMRNTVLQIDPKDNVLIALTDLAEGHPVSIDGQQCVLVTDVPAKHKFALRDFIPGDPIVMSGVLVGKAVMAIRRGELITTRNIRHEVASYGEGRKFRPWRPPDVSKWKQRTFLGYHRPDGQVGTRNYWIVLPLVFCENRNLSVLKQAFEEELGFAAPQVYRRQVAELVRLYREGNTEALRKFSFSEDKPAPAQAKVFRNVDGIKFLIHEGGCGGTREDAQNLCSLLAGYIHHPNVAGATVLSLGCQNAQVAILREEIKKRDRNFTKPLFVFEQQQSGSEFTMLSEAIEKTFQ